GMHIVSGSDGCTVRTWDAASGQLVGSPLQGYSRRVHCVVYSPDGMRIVSSSNDRTIRIWDSATGAPIVTIRGHTHCVSSVAFS
ncbi:WD40 repeat-like protein, partial [Exidia glandulosa HHB12029]